MSDKNVTAGCIGKELCVAHRTGDVPCCITGTETVILERNGQGCELIAESSIIAGVQANIASFSKPFDLTFTGKIFRKMERTRRFSGAVAFFISCCAMDNP
jgi:hypothetical protein